MVLSTYLLCNRKNIPKALRHIPLCLYAQGVCAQIQNMEAYVKLKLSAEMSVYLRNSVVIGKK